MTYFLDFDRTLFNFDAFVTVVARESPQLGPAIDQALILPPGAPKRQAVWDHLSDLLQSGALVIEPSAVARCVYDDAQSFVARHMPDIVVVTAGDGAFQGYKVKHAFPSASFRDVLFCGERGNKGSVIREWLREDRQDAIFVDDAETELTSVSAACPWIRLFEMRRDGKEGSGNYPVIHSLTELP